LFIGNLAGGAEHFHRIYSRFWLLASRSWFRWRRRRAQTRDDFIAAQADDLSFGKQFP